MKFETDKNIITTKVENLEPMSTYLIWDEETKEQSLLIRKFDEVIILQKASNCDELCTLGCALDRIVNVIGKVNYMDVINIKTTKPVSKRGLF